MNICLFLKLFFCKTVNDNVAPSIGESEKINYYANLIKEETWKSEKFVLPTDNRRYFGNTVPSDFEAIDIGEFDFIVVGAGSSGSVIFNRLSENENWKILLLEAGGNETDYSDIPSMAFNLQYTKMNWGYFTTPQKKSCQGMINNQCPCPRGLTIGGSGTINALMYIRGNKEDFDRWEKQGNPGWSYKEILPYFKKSEKFEEDDGDDGYHSTNGLWNVTHPKPGEHLTSVFFDACKELGYKYVDYNGRNQIGYSKLQMSLNRGKRASGGRSFIDPIRHKQNVKIILNALVTKVLINEENSAYGVNFMKNGKLYTAKVRKEVILSGGAINTPQLLILSGIGPKKHLKQLNIPVIKDLPVGKNLQDHQVYLGINVRTNYTYQDKPLVGHIKDFLKGEGLLTYALNTQGIKFVNTASPKSSTPDIEYIFVPPPSTSPAMARIFNVKTEIEKTVFNLNKLTDFKLLIVLLHPKSVGEVTLKSNNPLDFPNINTNFLTDKRDEDVKTIYRAIIHARNIINTNAFKKLNATLLNEVPCCMHHKMNSKKYWFCTIRHITSTLYHTSGTTRMGPLATNSVVNHQLKVHGIKKLRVGDCGIIPSTTSGHTNAPAFMIGEKLADLVKQEYR